MITENESTKAKLDIIKRITSNCLEAKNVISKKDEEIKKLKEIIEYFGHIMYMSTYIPSIINDKMELINKRLDESIGKQSDNCIEPEKL